MNDYLRYLWIKSVPLTDHCSMKRSAHLLSVASGLLVKVNIEMVRSSANKLMAAPFQCVLNGGDNEAGPCFSISVIVLTIVWSTVTTGGAYHDSPLVSHRQSAPLPLQPLCLSTQYTVLMPMASSRPRGKATSIRETVNQRRPASQR